MSWLSRILWGGDRKLPASWDEWIGEARSHSGYVREAAVNALAMSGHGAALPVLLERANDWVPEVRCAARKAIDAFLTDEHIESWGRALGLVAALRRAARADHSRLLQDIEAFLTRPANLATLKAAQKGLSPDAIRLLFSLELRSADDDEARYRTLQSGVLSSDVVVASNAVAAVETLQLPARRINLAGAACFSGFAPVRAAGLRAALQTRDSSVSSLVRAMCRDRSASVRAIALAALTEGRELVVDEARGAFRNGKTAQDRAVALDLLCDLDPDAALALCEQASTDDAAAVRRVAHARRFAVADGDERDEMVLLALRDGSPRVRRLAAVQVKKGASAPRPEILLDIHQVDPSALNSLASVAVHLSPWARLDFLLNAMHGSRADDAAVQRIERELGRWSSDMVRCFVRPAEDEARKLARAWAMARDELPSDLQQGLVSHLLAFDVLRS